jgi:purine-binding chemotaxis protein CheW
MYRQKENYRLSNTDQTHVGDGKYLTFNLSEEGFGIAILKVKEIIGMMQFTPIPKTPEFIKGVINLRGKVIPVIDLRLKFGMDSIPYDERTCIIVAEVQNGSGTTSMGIVVDAVNDVSNIKEEDIEETPSFGVSLDTQYIMGMAKAGGEVKILLDIDKVLSDAELEAISQAA